MSQCVLPCPFCGEAEDISDGEVLIEIEGKHYKQSECGGCGALGPRAEMEPDEVDYGDVKARKAWNRRPKPVQPAAFSTTVSINVSDVGLVPESLLKDAKVEMGDGYCTIVDAKTSKL